MSGIKILKASYGVGSKNIDVTSAVSSHIKDGELNLVVTPDALNVTDPAPNQTKQLNVTYTINNGSKNSTTINDNGILLLSAPPERKADGLQIVKAEYGYPGNFTDVTSAVQTHVRNGAINLKVSPSNIGVPDPNPNKQKTLTVDYTLNGSKNSQSFTDNQVFKLDAPPETQPDNQSPSQHVLSIGWIIYKGISYFLMTFLYVLSIYSCETLGAAMGAPGYVLGAIGVILPYVAFWGFPVVVFIRRLIYTTDLVIGPVL